MNAYIGHPHQLSGVEEVRLVGGKGDGMRLYQVRNGRGLEMVVNPDRCMDLPRLTFRGINCSFFSPCGYVAPAFYDKDGAGFLKSFTAGFLTTCGLTTVGTPEVENGELLPLHGNVGNLPADEASYVTEEDSIVLRGRVNTGVIFADKLVLERKITCSLKENTFTIEDTVRNEGDKVSPLMLLYHMNLGYPLLSEKAKLTVASSDVKPRDARAAEDFSTCHEMLPPTPGFQEQCYLHSFHQPEAFAKLENPEEGIGLEISFDSTNLPCLTEWKMMGFGDYVLGLEPGICFPTGRVTARKENTLQFIKPMEERKFRIQVKLYDCKA